MEAFELFLYHFLIKITIYVKGEEKWRIILRSSFFILHFLYFSSLCGRPLCSCMMLPLSRLRASVRYAFAPASCGEGSTSYLDLLCLKNVLSPKAIRSSILVRFTMSVEVHCMESYPTSSIVCIILPATRNDLVNVISLSPRLNNRYLSINLSLTIVPDMLAISVKPWSWR